LVAGAAGNGDGDNETYDGRSTASAGPFGPAEAVATAAADSATRTPRVVSGNVRVGHVEV